MWKTKDRKIYVAVKCFYEDKAEARGGFVEEVIKVQLYCMAITGAIARMPPFTIAT